jgi:hypothetical protein
MMASAMMSMTMTIMMGSIAPISGVVENGVSAAMVTMSAMEVQAIAKIIACFRECKLFRGIQCNEERCIAVGICNYKINGCIGIVVFNVRSSLQG